MEDRLARGSAAPHPPGEATAARASWTSGMERSAMAGLYRELDKATSAKAPPRG